MSELLIINHQLDKKILYEIENSISKKKIYYINFVENYQIDLKKKNFIQINNGNSFQSFCLKKIKSIFKIIKSKKISKDFWRMKISEFNLADKFWKDYLKKEYILEIIKIKKIKKIKVFLNSEDYMFNKLIEKLHSAQIYKDNKNYLSKNYIFYKFYFFGIYLIKIINLIRELKNIKLLKKERKINLDRYKNIFFANYPDHFNKKFEINYSKNDNSFFYYVSLIRNNSNFLNQPSKKKYLDLIKKRNFEFIEKDISYLETIRNYFFNSKIIKKKITYNLNLLGIKNYHEKFINFYHRHVELPKLINYETGIKKTLSKINNSKSVHYGYFEFIEGRIISKNLHGNFKNFIGYQHAFMGFFQKIRCLEVLNFIDKDQLPRKISFFQQNLPKNLSLKFKKIKLVFKKRIYKKKKFFKYNKKINILVFSDLHNIKSYNKFLISLKYNKNVNYFFRPHPKNIKYYQNFFSKNSFNNLRLDVINDYKKSITKNKINFIITSSYTGVLNEVSNMYWPILVLNFKNQMPNININKYFEKNFIISNFQNIKFKKYYSMSMRNKFIKFLNI